MKPGAVSRVIPGPRGRFWIIKLVDRRQDPATTFESVRPVIEGLLRASGRRRRATRPTKDLRAHAKVVRRARHQAASGAPAAAAGAPVEP